MLHSQKKKGERGARQSLQWKVGARLVLLTCLVSKVLTSSSGGSDVQCTVSPQQVPVTSARVNEPAAGGSGSLPSGDLAVPQLLSMAFAAVHGVAAAPSAGHMWLHGTHRADGVGGRLSLSASWGSGTSVANVCLPTALTHAYPATLHYLSLQLLRGHDQDLNGLHQAGTGAKDSAKEQEQRQSQGCKAEIHDSAEARFHFPA